MYHILALRSTALFALGVVAEWSKVLTADPWPFMVWSTLALGTYQLRFVSWVFHVIFSLVHFISLYTLGGLRAFRKPLPYNMYLFNLQIAYLILIKILIFVLLIASSWHLYNRVAETVAFSCLKPLSSDICQKQGLLSLCNNLRSKNGTIVK